MIHFLTQCFSWVCAQTPSHTWAPGGLPLPCCQRCTGLYVGAALALMLHLVLRLQSDAASRRAHVWLVLQMIPFGLHWVPQDGLLRTASGFLFGFGVVAFLWALPAEWTFWRAEPRRRAWRLYAGLGVAGLSLLLVAASVGGVVTAHGLAGLAGLGAVGLSLLVVVNLGLAVVTVLLCRPHSPSPASP